ncbi:kelch-like protein 10 [Haemaphysalis longicornis]
MASSMPALRALTTSREHCDVVLRTTDCAELWEHRFVLATRYTGCGAFLSCSKEKTSFLFERTPEHEDIAWPPISKANVSDLSSKMFELLVDLAYQVPIQESAGLHNAREVLDLAGALDITTVRDHCLQLLGGNSEPEDCVCTYQLSLGNEYHRVSSKAFRYIVRNFDNVLAANSEFPSLMPEELISVLHDDELLMPNEVESAFGAILKWIAGNIEDCRGHFPRQLPLIRIAFCSHADMGKVESDRLVRASKPALEVLFVVKRTLSDVYWRTRPDLSERRWLKQKVPKIVLFMVGGWTGGASNHLLPYNCRSSRWLLQPLQNTHQRAYHGGAMLEGLIYFVGGFDDHDCYHTVVILITSGAS